MTVHPAFVCSLLFQLMHGILMVRNILEERMTKAEIKELISKCILQKKICNVYFRYDQYYWNLIPLKTSDKLFLAVKEDDFILNGYTIRRFKDVKKAKAKDDMCDQILTLEGITNMIQTPDINIDSWKTVIESLKSAGNNIIVERENLDDDEWEFVIGRVERIYNRFAYVRHFDADGIWQEEPYRIPYSEITSITFSSRYVDTFSKYVGAVPEN